MAMSVNEAVKLVSDLLEANHISCTTSTIEDEVQSWYDHSDVADPEMLAGAVLEWGYWRMVSYSDWCDAKAKWFCGIPVEYAGYPSINEIEMAQHDIVWQGGMEW